ETLPLIPKLLQVSGDGGIKPGGLGLLLPQHRGEPPHLLLERLAVVLLRLGADVAARREHMAVLADLLQRRALAEARYVGVLARLLLATPGVAGVSDAGDVFVGQLAVRAVYHTAHLACVNKEHVATTITELAVLLVARQEPQARRNLR